MRICLSLPDWVIPLPHDIFLYDTGFTCFFLYNRDGTGYFAYFASEKLVNEAYMMPSEYRSLVESVYHSVDKIFGKEWG